jgi:hypothetical protein
MTMVMAVPIQRTVVARRGGLVAVVAGSSDPSALTGRGWTVTVPGLPISLSSLSTRLWHGRTLRTLGRREVVTTSSLSDLRLLERDTHTRQSNVLLQEEVDRFAAEWAPVTVANLLSVRSLSQPSD